MIDKKLIEKYLNGSLTAEEQQQFDAYMANGALQGLEEMMEQEWLHNEQLSQPIDKEITNKIRKQINTKITLTNKVLTFVPRRIMAIAASIALLLIAGWFLLLRTTIVEDGLVQQFENTTDDIQTIILKDGSTVVLNQNSSLTYSEREQTRNVALIGEAFFEVTKKPNAPFTVTANGIHTTALGTSFNIKAFEESDQVVVSLVTGKVAVRSSTEEQNLIPNQQLVYDKLTQRFAQQNFDLEDVNDWRNGAIVFKDTPLSEVLLDVARFFNQQIIFEKEMLNKCLISSSFTENNTMEEVLTVLAFSKNLNIKKENKNYIIIGSGCD